ncbi:MAG: hypothetical protein SGPRY_002215, partial [Prymnesium sp.]
ILLTCYCYESMSDLEALMAAVARLGEVCPWTAAQRSEDMMLYLRKECIELDQVLLQARTRPLNTAELTQELGDVLFDVLMLIQVSARDHGVGLEACCNITQICSERGCRNERQLQD